MSSALVQLMSSAGTQDGLAWTLCLLGGFLAGTYPVFIKAPRVMATKVNPIVFQCYKSFWVFTVSWIFLLVNFLRGKPLLTFTYWGVVGAFLWVPSGFANIAAVSMCGCATATVISSGMNSVVQFLTGIMTNQRMKTYGASEVPLAPFYLGAMLLGMAGLIASPTLFVKQGQGKEGEASASTMCLTTEAESILLRPARNSSENRRTFIVGVLLAAVQGCLGGMKTAISSIGQQIEKANTDPAVVASEFGVFESYMMSFGLGCALSTTALVGILALIQKGCRKKDLPSAEFHVMKLYGFLVGCMWFGHYMCGQAANNVGGGGSFGPAENATGLIVSGLWGLLYYREVKEPARVVCWVLCAVWTTVFVILLTGELTDAE